MKRRPADEAKLLSEMRRLARRNPRWGSPRIHDGLRKRGWTVNHKRVERLWKEEGMQVPEKQQKRRRIALGGSENSCVHKRALRPNHVWSYDFIEDRTEKNRKFRMLVVLDEFTRESLAIEVANQESGPSQVRRRRVETVSVVTATGRHFSGEKP